MPSRPVWRVKRRRSWSRARRCSGPSGSAASRQWSQSRDQSSNRDRAASWTRRASPSGKCSPARGWPARLREGADVAGREVAGLEGRPRGGHGAEPAGVADLAGDLRAGEPGADRDPVDGGAGAVVGPHPPGVERRGQPGDRGGQAGLLAAQADHGRRQFAVADAVGVERHQLVDRRRQRVGEAEPSPRPPPGHGGARRAGRVWRRTASEVSVDRTYVRILAHRYEQHGRSRPPTSSRPDRVRARTVPVVVSGTCDPAFRPVWDAFAANLEEGELGAACSITVDGRVVVDVWGGWTDSSRRREWTRDTMVNAYSVGKPVIALRLLQLIERGPIELDDRRGPVVARSCWPGSGRDRPGPPVPPCRRPRHPGTVDQRRAVGLGRDVRGDRGDRPVVGAGARVTPTTPTPMGTSCGEVARKTRWPAPRHLAARRDRGPARGGARPGASPRRTGHGARTSSGRSTSPPESSG